MSPQLQAFMAIAEHKTVHAAARAIHMTQTAVTQRIRVLEARLKTTLFVRTRAGMRLTSEGQALLRYCFSVSELEGETLASITGAAVDTTIRMVIAGPTSVMNSRVIHHCLPLMTTYPNLLLTFNINDIEDKVQLLRVGECQFAILEREAVMPEMEYKVLAPERYVLVCTKAWKHRSLQAIIGEERIIDYDASDEMTFNYLRHYGLIEGARHDRHYVNRTDAMAMMLVAGSGYGVLTAEFSAPYVSQGQLHILNQGEIYENALALAWYKRPEPPGYFTALIQAIS